MEDDSRGHHERRRPAPVGRGSGPHWDLGPWLEGIGGSDCAVVDDSTVIELLRVLGDPVRWAAVSRLRHGSCCACDLAELAGVSPSLLSHHMGVLRDADVVTAQRQGRWVHYTLVDGVLDQLGSVVAGEVLV